MPNLMFRAFQLQKIYGTAYLFSWAQRLSGIGLTLFLWAHIYTLSALSDPLTFDSKVKWFNQVGLAYLEWLLALPVIFHALNGARLILYEIFGSRREEMLAAWVAALTIAYSVFLFLMMTVYHFSPVSAALDISLMISLAAASAVVAAIRQSKMGIYWKIQRISGAFLLMMIPVHLVFMHANPSVGHDSAVILSRLRSGMLIPVTNFLMLAGALYHGSYGLISIAKDYLHSEASIRYLSILIALFSALFAWLGIQTLAIGWHGQI